MYKKIGSFNFSTYSFIPEIDDLVDSFASKALDELKYSIYVQFILQNNEFEFANLEKNLVRDVVSKNIVFGLDIPSEMALMVLSQIFNIEIEEFLKVPFNELEKSRNKKVEILFEDFQIKDSAYESLNSISFPQNEVSNSYPRYYKLYRARNCILKKFNQRYYSHKTLTKLVQNIYEEFKQGLYTICLSKNHKKLSFNSLDNILNKVINEYINQILNSVKLGKTMEEGEQAAYKINSLLNTADIKSKVFNAYNFQFKTNFSDTLKFESYVSLAEELIKIIETYLKDIPLKIEKIHVERFSDYRMIVLGEIFGSFNNAPLLIGECIDAYDEKLKSETVKKVLEENLSISEFEIALRVQNIAIDEKIYKKPLLEDVEVLSHSMFLSWQSEIYDALGGHRKPTFVDISNNEKDNSTWFIVKGFSCGNKDTELAYSIGKDKLTRYLELLYYFVSPEDEYDFKIADPYVLYNKNSGNLLLGRKESGYKRAKKIDDFSNELFLFLNKLSSSQQKISNNIKSSIKLYYEFINTEDIFAKAKLLVSILEAIFAERESEKLSMYSAIIIAGTNYSSKAENITFKNMREILYWDLIEFIDAVRSESHPLMLEETIDRFKVFTKNILGTYIYNIPWEDREAYAVKDILLWILHINPADEHIYHGGAQND
ncbi:hypothetical protein [Lysinibacillus sp. FJAT-14222]|uniref:hypothetical protein n=1 Tax=Lysinibacillus sp. FJAT-14222 TaxID=1932366 RepID=UPI0006AE04C0|nr:hypothetical protein [Lysinibacillus sp. FJAT-14222]KOS63811.1 hypothetical protein AN161_04245 [Lysinibacillus sp. FJAT-14222]